MNFKIIKTLLILAVGIVIGTLLPRLLEKNEATQEEMNTFSETKEVSRTSDSKAIDELTSEEVVIPFVKQNGTLPSYYLTKSEAKKKGWIPSQGNLCEVLPGQAIGGDRFSNREGKLPKGEQYFEADVNYNCGNRGADRIVFTKKGEVWLTHNHYKSFQKQ
ncbi:ribonuclease domain-containing protein [Bergeyella porcorum]|uniref:ribonuclease domain-containing protein n=1 Tax=Bergeyella porcorum TaxID=1735111 RepID=UPI0035EAEEF6